MITLQLNLNPKGIKNGKDFFSTAQRDLKR